MLTSLTVENIHDEFQVAFPELAVPYAWCSDDAFSDDEGRPLIILGLGSLLRDYIAVLLSLPPSPARDQALQRAFTFVERLDTSKDMAVVSIVEDAVIEDPSGNFWWFQCAWPFAGPHLRATIQRMYGQDLTRVLNASGPPAQVTPVDRHDLWDIRDAVVRLLAHEGITRETMPEILKD